MFTNLTLKFTGILKNPETEILNTLTSLEAPPHSNLRFPTLGFNVFYGKSTLQDFQEMIRDEESEALKSNVKPDSIELVELSCIGTRHQEDAHWFDTYQDKTIFDIRRLSTGSRSSSIHKRHNVKEELLSFFHDKAKNDFGHEYLVDHGCINKKTNEINNYILELFPQYIDNLYTETDWMKNIDAIIWSARSGAQYEKNSQTWKESGKLLIRATIFNLNP